MPADRPLSIGAVVRDLADEFPDLTISKVRFLETEGLLDPVRTASGYRQYSPSDVDRLRWVLRAQRDRFWPLAAIRAALEAADRGLTPAGPDGSVTLPGPEADPPPDGLPTTGRPRATAAEVADATGLTRAQVDALVEHGILRPAAGEVFGAEDLRAARAAAALADVGLEPRHLRVFRAAADREVDLLAQATASLRGDEAVTVRAELLRHALGLHAALVRTGLDEASDARGTVSG